VNGIPAGNGGVPFAPAMLSVAMHGELTFIGDGRSPEVRVFDANRLTRIIRWPRQPEVITDDLLDALVSATVPLNALDRETRILTQVNRARSTGIHTFPYYARFEVDGEGRLWVQDYYLGRNLVGSYPATWIVFDESGVPLGRVELPRLPESEGFEELQGFGRSMVAIRWLDAAGFAHLTLHDVLRP
jgi:hypothetical protein